ncbi:DUF4864 domain-containing protein [Halomicroarcula sp. F13]|uniref:DUF4864 domain-containing protein n=1 Tax=Haloarcula rubra TaxID=2487747 RepID=A0AAW4PS45_9EURY|nr:DUF4864 domain-containing protein [Halomicroarcula rubra]MBX0323218.1 DUF4864 domain-containing protein [Halomicroarcula rubra]
MTRADSPLFLVACVALVALAGCGTFFGSGGGQSEGGDPLTPAPRPEVSTASPTPEPNGRSLAGDPDRREYWGGITAPDNRTGAAQPRYLSLRPTCQRPPGLVVHIQVNALRNNDPATNEGINTTWQFAAPTNRRAVGSYETFVDVVTTQFRPLLNASTVTYEPLERDGARAHQRVTVFTGETSATYRWHLELQTVQTTEPYGGCWMTTGVTTE